MFVDMLSVSQYHGEGTPEFVGSFRFRLDEAGEVSTESAGGRILEGSHDTRLNIKSHAGRVTVWGNPSRFNRPDNLFGLSLDDCMTVVNDQLGRLGLPPFTEGDPTYHTGKIVRLDQVHDLPEWTGARFSMLHLTENYSAGSDFLAKLAIRAYRGRVAGYMRKHAYGDDTVMWVNSRRTIKAYRKGPDMAVHCKESPWTQWATDNGIVRHEVELKSRYLSATRLSFWGNATMARLYHFFRAETEILRRCDASLDPLAVEHVPARSRLVYASWLKGENVRELLPRATFYRHRKALLDAASIDIAETRQTAGVVPIVRTVDLRPAVAPESYWSRAA